MRHDDGTVPELKYESQLTQVVDMGRIIEEVYPAVTS